MKKRSKFIIATVAVLLLAGSFGAYKVFAEQSGSSPESGLTSRIKTIYDELATKSFGSDTNTPDWGAFWNRLRTAANWTAALGDATEADVATGKKFYAGDNRTLETGNALAGSDYGIPKTGQTTSYPNGNGTDRDDGHYQSGKPASGVHYANNSNGTITDNATGLMWLQDPSLAGGGTYPNTWASAVNTPTYMRWSAAIANCEALTYPAGSYSDWRLPNIKELQSIINYGNVALATGEATGNEAPFINTRTTFYWSGTTSVVDAGFIMHADFNLGQVDYGSKTNFEYVRCVRQ